MTQSFLQSRSKLFAKTRNICSAVVELWEILKKESLSEWLATCPFDKMRKLISWPFDQVQQLVYQLSKGIDRAGTLSVEHAAEVSAAAQEIKSHMSTIRKYFYGHDDRTIVAAAQTDFELKALDTLDTLNDDHLAVLLLRRIYVANFHVHNMWSSVKEQALCTKMNTDMQNSFAPHAIASITKVFCEFYRIAFAADDVSIMSPLDKETVSDINCSVKMHPRLHEVTFWCTPVYKPYEMLTETKPKRACIEREDKDVA
jgi:hypothetical protein